MASSRGAKKMDLAKQLVVRINVCKRMDKEVRYYHSEAADNEAKVKKMKEEGKEGYETKQWEEVLQESYMMIPDSTQRFNTSLEELLAFLEEHAQEEAVAACADQLTEAKALLKAHGLEYFEQEGASSAPAAGAAAEEEFKEGEIF